MPTATPKFDPTGRWKAPRFSEREWEDLNRKVERDLRPYYPHSLSEVEIAEAFAAGFGHPADEWARVLLYAALSEISPILLMRRRLTNEEMREERKQTLRVLRNAAECLTNFSDDLNRMLPREVEVLDCRDSINALIPHIEALGDAIGRLPKATRRHEAHHQAAKRMAIAVLRKLSADGIPPSATAQTEVGEASKAVKILMVLGAALDLNFVDTTWKDIVRKVQPFLKSEKVAKAPRKRGASTT
jgi:hypothetical protein